MREWLRTRSGVSRHVNLVALALPSISLVYWLRNPHPLYELEVWAWLALIPVCLVQFLRPTFVGWSVVVAGYAWPLIVQIQKHIGEFEDIGSEDHSRWEGWSMELALLGLTAWLLLVLVLMVIYRPRKQAGAT